MRTNAHSTHYRRARKPAQSPPTPQRTSLNVNICRCCCIKSRTWGVFISWYKSSRLCAATTTHQRSETRTGDIWNTFAFGVCLCVLCVAWCGRSVTARVVARPKVNLFGIRSNIIVQQFIKPRSAHRRSHRSQFAGVNPGKRLIMCCVYYVGPCGTCVSGFTIYMFSLGTCAFGTIPLCSCVKDNKDDVLLSISLHICLLPAPARS